MERIITNLYGKELIKAMSGMLDDFIQLDYDEGDIYNCIKQINESIRIGLYLLALELNNGSLAYKLNQVNKKVNQERLDKFKSEFDKGRADVYLAILGKIDKKSLLVDLGLDVLENEVCKLSKINKEYYDVIMKSLLEDQKIDCRDGIDDFLTYKKND